MLKSFRKRRGDWPKWLRKVRENTSAPEKPQDLLRHECIGFRWKSDGALYAWELERGKKSWRVPVRGGVVCNDSRLAVAFAEAGVGLMYAFEPMVLDTDEASSTENFTASGSPPWKDALVIPLR